MDMGGGASKGVPKTAAEGSSAAIAPPPPPAIDETTAWGKQQVLRETWAKNDVVFRAWHAKAAAEEVLEPELPIVDPHHHLWDMRSLKGFNLFGMFKQQYYMVEELAEDILASGHNVKATVYAEAHAFGGGASEVRFAQGIAAQFAAGGFGGVKACAGIIGGVDLAGLGAEAGAVLKEIKDSCPNFVGIRINGQHDEKLKDGFKVKEPGLYAGEKFRAGFAALGPLGLSFDAFVYSAQLDDVRELALAFPDTTIVLNHMGVPACSLGDFGDHAPEYAGKQSEIVKSWQAAMRAIAEQCPNVVVKLGGLIACLGHGWAAREAPVGSAEVAAKVAPLMTFVIETFGAKRLMFESNFPVDKVNFSYRAAWNAYKLVAREAGVSDEDRALLFSGTAARVYRLVLE